MSSLIHAYRTTLLCSALAFGMTACTSKQDPTNTTPPTPIPTAIVKVDGDTQTGTVGTALGTSLVVQVNDQNGAAMQGVSVSFSVTSGGGSHSAASSNTNSSGQASSDWTLGTTSGAQVARVSVTSNTGINTDFSATADADVPAALTLVGGDMQTGLVSQLLANPIEVKVEDQFGNGVSNQPVTFSITSGAGSQGTTDANTGADGLASTTWTLGPGTGTQTAAATAAGLTGSPIAFTAIATTLSLSSVTPDPLVEGGTATLTGTGFDLTPGNNAVTVDGVAAIVTGATLTSLTITVPTFDCQPARDVSITVGVSGETSNAINQRLNPATTMSIAVGEQQILSTPADFCLNFLADGTGGDSYLIGASATEEVDDVMPFMLTAVAGASSSPPLFLTAPDVLSSSRPRGRMLTPLEQDELEREYAYQASELRIRQWERENAGLPLHPAIRSSVAAWAVPDIPNVGDQFTIKVPNIASSNLCANPISITVEVKKVGDHGIISVDLANPADVAAGDDPFDDADLQSFSDTFDNDIYDMLIANFDAPSDIDNNGGRIWVVLTIEVNKFSVGAAGFVSSTDLLDPASCAASNQGETFYGYVPDPQNTAAGPFAQTRSNVVGNMPALITHEVTHIIQQSRRGSNFMAVWEAEGQADLAKELLGFSQRSDLPGQDYGRAKIIANGTGDALYAQRFSRLGRYFGWDLNNSPAGKIPNTPHNCSLFRYKDAIQSLQCTSAFFYGASWSMHRWILDRFGPTYPGGVTQLEKDWIGKNPTLRGRANVEALVGVNFDDLFAQWAAMLYVDGRVTGLSSELQMTSWDLYDVFQLFDP
ncbi:MAG: Ig-like domain-containing protein, partial [Gemmatimonadetes bacterium]|nr:Ig-like domain-containing protein [Gemmatimonadota bacterium]